MATALSVVNIVVDGPVWLPWAVIALWVVALLANYRGGVPDADTVDVRLPCTGRWVGFNSPADNVPSHGLHTWGQTYAIDLVHEPEEGSRPETGWWPLTRRPDEYPGFGAPILSPVDGVVVRATDGRRDHGARTSPPALALMLSIGGFVRMLLGPSAMLGNHVTVRTTDDVYVVVAHLRRDSVRPSVGDVVAAGDVVGACGNSGNTTEPHVHVQVMDRRSPTLAAGVPMRFIGYVQEDGSAGGGLPSNGTAVEAPPARPTPDRIRR